MNSAGLAALAATAAAPLTDLSASDLFADKKKPPPATTSGIQIGADSFADEGTEKVLDILEEKGAVNTLYLSTFTYDRGITGRPGPGKNYPGHGVEASDKNYFHGGNYATPHAQYYTRTAIKGEKLKAPDLGNLFLPISRAGGQGAWHRLPTRQRRSDLQNLSFVQNISKL